jgi:flagellar motor switch/type III secretory pathway protein FliN
MSDKQLPEDTSGAVSSDGVADKWQQLWWVPCELSLHVPVAQFTVGELLRLRPGGVVATAWSRGTEIPLHANGQLIGWAEFEPVGGHIGARITELV